MTTDAKPLTPEQLEAYRQKINRREPVSDDEYRAIITSIRASRGEAIKSSSSKAASTAAVVSAQERNMDPKDLAKSLGIL